jgi:hypothetical protein
MPKIMQGQFYKARQSYHLPNSDFFQPFDNGASVAQSSEESVNALPKVVGFLRVLRFPPTWKVDRMG